MKLILESADAAKYLTEGYHLLRRLEARRVSERLSFLKKTILIDGFTIRVMAAPISGYIWISGGGSPDMLFSIPGDAGYTVRQWASAPLSYSGSSYLAQDEASFRAFIESGVGRYLYRGETDLLYPGPALASMASPAAKELLWTRNDLGIIVADTDGSVAEFLFGSDPVSLQNYVLADNIQTYELVSAFAAQPWTGFNSVALCLDAEAPFKYWNPGVQYVPPASIYAKGFYLGPTARIQSVYSSDGDEEAPAGFNGPYSTIVLRFADYLKDRSYTTRGRVETCADPVGFVQVIEGGIDTKEVVACASLPDSFLGEPLSAVAWRDNLGTAGGFAVWRKGGPCRIYRGLAGTHSYDGAFVTSGIELIAEYESVVSVLVSPDGLTLAVLVGEELVTSIDLILVSSGVVRTSESVAGAEDGVWIPKGRSVYPERPEYFSASTSEAFNNAQLRGAVNPLGVFTIFTDEGNKPMFYPLGFAGAAWFITSEDGRTATVRDWNDTCFENTSVLLIEWPQENNVPTVLYKGVEYALTEAPFFLALGGFAASPMTDSEIRISPSGYVNGNYAIFGEISDNLISAPTGLTFSDPMVIPHIVDDPGIIAAPVESCDGESPQFGTRTLFFTVGEVILTISGGAMGTCGSGGIDSGEVWDGTGIAIGGGGCDSTVFRATDSCGRQYTRTFSSSFDLEITGPEAVTIGAGWSGAGGLPPYTVSVTGGANLVNNVVVSIDPGSCGTGLATVTDACGNTSSMEVRYASGRWCQVDVVYTTCAAAPGGTVCDITTGGDKYSYFFAEGCSTTPINPGPLCSSVPPAPDECLSGCGAAYHISVLKILRRYRWQCGC